MNKHYYFKLPNQLPVLFIPTKGTSVTSIVLVKVGSRYESARESGLAHFLEHMHFKGTKKRSTFLELNKDLDALGAEYNAFTDKEVTGYWIKSQTKTFEAASELLSDIVFHSTFPEYELTREKTVIIEELKMYEDNPLLKIGDLLAEATFGNVPLGWNIGGTIKTVSKLTHSDLVHFHRAHYTPSQMLVVVAGNVSFPRVRQAAQKYFAHPLGAKKKRRHSFAPFNKFRHDFLLKRFESGQVNLAFSLPAFKHKDPRIVTLKMLSVIVGEGMSSRLFTEIREKRGLCYSISSSADSLHDTGTFSVSAGLDHGRFEEAFQTIWEVLEDVRKKGVSQEELDRAKTNIRGKFLISLENSDSVARYWGSNVLFREKFESPAVLLRRMRKVTLREVNELARVVFNRKAMSLAVIGEFKDEEEIRKVTSKA